MIASSLMLLFELERFFSGPLSSTSLSSTVWIIDKVGHSFRKNLVFSQICIREIHILLTINSLSYDVFLEIFFIDPQGWDLLSLCIGRIRNIDN